MPANALRAWWRSVEVAPDGCWLWTRQTSVKGGYALHTVDGKTVRAHRWGYEMFVADIPAGLPLDHTCHDPSVCRPPLVCQHRRCVNPSHLEPVTTAENNQRAKRDTCRRGHPWDNPIIRTPTGGRECRICYRERRRKK